MKLELNGLQKQFENHSAISLTNILIPECQTLVIIGPSGGGKSTLLRLVAGLEYPDKGEIILNGNPIIFKENALLQHRRNLGIVFQAWNLFPHLTALENIILPLHHVHKLSKEEALERSLQLLRRFDLGSHAHKKPSALSGGQVQRVALIRAVAAQPKMLMLDEPTSALDPLMTVEVLDLIRELKNEGMDIFLVTHHLQFVRHIAQRVLFIANGMVLEEGSVEEIFENPVNPLVKKYMKSVLTY